MKWPKADMIAAEKEAAAKKRKLEGGAESSGKKNAMVNGTGDHKQGTNGQGEPIFLYC